MRSLVFTDLDGTLLDHHTYALGEAAIWLQRLKRAQIPVVINTSKTATEVHHLQKTLALQAPFGVENGAAVYYPPSMDCDLPVDGQGWHYEVLGLPAKGMLDFLHSHTHLIKTEILSQMPIEAITQKTGLTPQQAEDAKNRSFSQPFFLLGGDLAAFEAKAAKAGLAVLKGGRFYHLIAAGQDKGRLLQKVLARYRTRWGEPVETIALGDSANDFAMLECADRAVLVAREDGTHAPYDRPGLIKAPRIGPAGWAWAMEQFVQKGVIDA